LNIMMNRGFAAAVALAAFTALGAVPALPANGQGMGADYRARLPQDEVVYFLLPDRFANGDTGNDRGGLSGDRLQTGFDPTAKGFYHGGDLKGLLSRLDYIQGLGATAVWLGPIYENKAVQGAPGSESAGYHGYWITDFTRVDPHFGTNDDLHALATALHARGMKLYLDIVVNHTADVIRYRECPGSVCPYRPLSEAPYTPYVPAGEEHLKVPDWLNDPQYYHNRGNSTFAGESSTLGDFNGLDDLMTENSRVVQGFIDIYAAWIDQFRVDGFRIDTAKHVNPEFWQSFVPAMLARAAADGIPNFHIFGEVASSELNVPLLAQHTQIDRLPAVLDFGFYVAVHDTLAGNAGTEELARLYAQDSLYAGGAYTALQLPTFVSNHDDGRFGAFLQRAQPQVSGAEALQRARLAQAMLLTLRGVPVIYYGDEQGFVGRGGDQDSRQDLFASQVSSYNDQPLLGTSATTATSNYNSAHPLYRLIAELAQLRQQQPALRRGLQTVRAAGPTPGLFAVSRIDPESGAEVLIAFNTSLQPLSAQVPVSPVSRQFRALHGRCAARATTAGRLPVRLPPLDFVICAAGVAR
jgi:glycosidase